nr:nuclear transport factor 2 family protein [Pseudomonas sp. SbOxS1]
MYKKKTCGKFHACQQWRHDVADFLRSFASEFAALDGSNLHRLEQLYSHDVRFSDPLHEVQGLAALQEYFTELYANVSELGFTFHGHDQVQDGVGYLRWTLHYRHPRLRHGQPIEVVGCSYLLWHEKVYQHRDYFDAGALLYEHLPLMGTAIGWLKGRLA